MRQVFNRNQLEVMWGVGIFICIFFIFTSGVENISSPYYYYRIDWNRALLYPVIIVGALLVITFSERELSKEEIAENLEKETRKRDKTFLRCWKKGMSDKELARKFNLKTQGVKALKERLKKTKEG